MSSEPPKPDDQLPQASSDHPQQRTPEVLQPENVQRSEQAQKRISLAIHQEQWSGPIPPPQVLEKLNQVIPGGAERVLRSSVFRLRP